MNWSWTQQWCWIFWLDKLWIRGTMHWRTLGIKKAGDVGVHVFVWGGE